VIVDAVFSILFAAAAAYALWRLWALISIERVDVGGRIIARSLHPTLFWIRICFELISALALGAIAISVAMGAFFKS
jgi:hypothetical protein